MPLASWATGQWYGPAAAAAVLTGVATPAAAVKGDARPAAVAVGAGTVPLAKPTRLVNRPATLVGVGTVPMAEPRGRVRAASMIRVNSLSQDDVTGAVLEAQIEPGLTLKQALRLLSAVLAGPASVAGDVVTFRNTADSVDRVTATLDGTGNRTDVVLDLSDG
jgi:hypothetical protein